MKKMIKVLCAGVFAMTLALSTVLAAPSATINGGVVKFTIGGKEVEGATISFGTKFDDVKDAEVTKDISTLNAGKQPSEVLNVAEVKNETDVKLDDALLLTQLQDLTVKDANGNVMTDATNVTVTWEVPNLKTGIGKEAVLHYSTVRNVWEVLDPSNVNYENKTITCNFKDLSPVAVIYVPANPTNTGNGTVNTGDNSQVALYAGLAVVALVAIAGIAYKSKKETSK